ncbi:flagellar biosynthesis repressor FlbT [Methylorubrum extorquens]|uniref:flagellar biosynthesis repressor FlbT n=1 Tax=Methylorubrum extorquens TaxID=408 RepID=UPI001AEBC12B|nr:flagellar biosynthesis repressor FlbT [Methylorubrum extorquens]
MFSLDGLSLAPEAGTICQRIYMLLQRIYDSKDHSALESEVVELANELMSATRTYDILFFYLYDSLMNLDYGKALQVGKLLLQHEAMLHDIASESAIERPSLLN